MKEFLIRFSMGVLACWFAKKYKTREKSEAWFASLKIDCVTGVGLALCIVLLPIVILFGLHHAGIMGK